MNAIKIMFAKVFGERNTGTNFLVKLLDANTNLINLTHSNKNDYKKRRMQQLTLWNAKELKSEQTRDFLKQRLVDAEREREFHLNFGWKHAKIQIERIENLPRFKDTLFICLIRNPWRFISALHRRPYNYLPKSKKNFEDFILSPLITNQRDGITDCFLDNPVELWNLKVNSYFNFAQKHPSNVRIVYYEEIMQDTQQFLDNLSSFCCLKNNIIIPQESTKNDKKTFEDYKQEVLNYSPLKVLGDKPTELISDRLDHTVFAKTIYSKMTSFMNLLPQEM